MWENHIGHFGNLFTFVVFRNSIFKSTVIFFKTKFLLISKKMVSFIGNYTGNACPDFTKQ